MQLIINIGKKHLYILALITVLLLTAIFATAYGSSNPAVFGHSEGELLVNSTSIVDGSITGVDIANDAVTGTQINEGTLSGRAGSSFEVARCYDGSYCSVRTIQPYTRSFVVVDNGALCISTNQDCTHASPSSGAELYVQGIDDPSGVVCVKADKALGTCTDQPDSTGSCTCT